MYTPANQHELSATPGRLAGAVSCSLALLSQLGVVQRPLAGLPTSECLLKVLVCAKCYLVVLTGAVKLTRLPMQLRLQA